MRGGLLALGLVIVSLFTLPRPTVARGGTTLAAGAPSRGATVSPRSPTGRARATVGLHDGSVDVTQFTSIQAAIDSLASTGGDIWFPRGTYVISAPIEVDKRGVRFWGEPGAVIQATPNPTFHMIDVTRGSFEAHGLTFDGNRLAPTSVPADIMRIRGGVGGQSANLCVLDRCYFMRPSRHQLYLNDVIEFFAESCVFTGSRNVAKAGENHYGVYGEMTSINNTHLRFLNCAFHDNDGGGCWFARAYGLWFDQCRFETNRGGTVGGEANGLKLGGGGGAATNPRVTGCHFEISMVLPPASRPNAYAWFGSCPSLYLVGNTFNGGADATTRPTHAAILDTSPNSFIAGNRVERMNADGIVISANCPSSVFIASWVDASSVDVLADKRLTYVGQCLRPPVYDTAQRDGLTGVVDGDMIFNSDRGRLQVRENGAWVEPVAATSTPRR